MAYSNNCKLRFKSSFIENFAAKSTSQPKDDAGLATLVEKSVHDSLSLIQENV